MMSQLILSFLVKVIQEHGQEIALAVIKWISERANQPVPKGVESCDLTIIPDQVLIEAADLVEEIKKAA